MVRGCVDKNLCNQCVIIIDSNYRYHISCYNTTTGILAAMRCVVAIKGMVLCWAGLAVWQ